VKLPVRSGRKIIKALGKINDAGLTVEEFLELLK
jgi:hypothetical protein